MRELAGILRIGAKQGMVMLDVPTRSDNVTRLPVAYAAASPVRDMSGSGFAGLMVLDILIPGSQSLKDKRQPLRSIKQRLRDAGFSVSEVDHHEKWQRAQVAVSIVGRGSGAVEDLLDDALRVFEARPDLDVSVRQRTVLAIDEYE
ncbi:MAG: hypothetical protein JWM90_2275 [Thermoleophilia bacterium]|nr:hypothetical protein [Thermoleophilia bacterium]